MQFVTPRFSTITRRFAFFLDDPTWLRTGILTLLLVLGLGMGQKVQAQIPQQVISAPNVIGPVSSVAADLDGDGNRDIVSASEGDDKIAWYENQVGENGSDGDGFGQQQVITTEADVVQSVVAADLDGDGDKDIVSLSAGNDELAWYENQIGESGADSDGFSSQRVIATPADLVAIAAADLDDNGDADVVSASAGDFYNDPKIAWYESQVGESGAESDGFGDQQIITTNIEDPESIATADLNGGGPEVIVGSSGTYEEDNKVTWYANEIGESGADSDGFGDEQIINSVFNPEWIGAASLDGDGDKDVLTYSASADEIVWYENQIGESGADSDGFGSEQTIITDLTNVSTVTAGDLNGDGNEDVVLIDVGGIVWYENQVGDSGGFGSKQTISSDVSSPESVSIANLNEDDSPEVLSASSNDNKVGWYENQIGESGTDSDGFGEQKTITLTGAVRAESVSAADLDGDGNQDVLSVTDGDGKVAWHENQIGESGSDSDGFGRQKVIVDTLTFPGSVVTADLDGDGAPDVLAGASSSITWYENQVGESGADSDGFGPAQTISSDDSDEILMADIDGDGDQDLISGGEFGSIHWYENQIGEDGADSDGFGDQQLIASNGERSQVSISTADLDGDGDPDVLSAAETGDVSSTSDYQIAWHENQVGESGTSSGFENEETINIQDRAVSVSISTADLDGDGAPDLLSGSDASSDSFDEDMIAWYENQLGTSEADSDGFGAVDTISTNVDGSASAIASNVDGDEALEILSASSGDNKIAWYDNQLAESDGFGTQQTITTNAQGARSVVTADLDGEGDQDVLSASQDDDKIAWYENTEGVLPVELAGFDATVDGDAVQLSWTTASEQNNAGFRVQRRGDAETEGRGDWTTIGRKQGAGTTTEAQSYRFTDANLPYEADKLTYRLKQVDTDGSAHFSDPVTVNRSVDKVDLLGTYPNPASQRATVRYALPEKQDVSLRLYDMLGRQVRTVLNGTQEGRHKQTLDVGGLPSGVYFLRLRAGGEVRTQKLTIAR